jgi:hypothetical protein
MILKLKKNKHTTGIKNVSVDWHNGEVVSLRAHVMRNGTTRTRRFLVAKFKDINFALARAIEHVRYLKNKATPVQFSKAYRRVGRPLQSEYFGRRVIRN